MKFLYSAISRLRLKFLRLWCVTSQMRRRFPLLRPVLGLIKKFSHTQILRYMNESTKNSLKYIP